MISQPPFFKILRNKNRTLGELNDNVLQKNQIVAGSKCSSRLGYLRSLEHKVCGMFIKHDGTKDPSGFKRCEIVATATVFIKVTLLHRCDAKLF